MLPEAAKKKIASGRLYGYRPAAEERSTVSHQLPFLLKAFIYSEFLCIRFLRNARLSLMGFPHRHAKERLPSGVHERSYSEDCHPESHSQATGTNYPGRTLRAGQ